MICNKITLSSLQKVVTCKHLGVGQAAYEAEALDYVTRDRIAAAMRVRAGGKTIKDEFRDVKAAVDVWAEKVCNAAH